MAKKSIKGLATSLLGFVADVCGWTMPKPKILTLLGHGWTVRRSEVATAKVGTDGGGLICMIPAILDSWVFRHKGKAIFVVPLTSEGWRTFSEN